MSNYISPYQKELNELQSQINDLKIWKKNQEQKQEQRDIEQARLDNVIIEFENIINKWRNS